MGAASLPPAVRRGLYQAVILLTKLMANGRIAELQSALGYTSADAATLKGVKRIWDKLELLRKKAEKDSQAEGAYREFLSKGIKQARMAQAPETVEEVIKESQALWAWYDQECERLGIAALESRRGLDHQAWCEKWLPVAWAEFDDAIGRMVEYPTPQSYADIQQAATKMLVAYSEAV